jgi:ketosteroid isomerase-like protein
MADPAIVERYLEALSRQDGAVASSLFTEDGVIDDYRGGHRAGRQVIEEFISSRGKRTIEQLSDVLVEGPRMTVYTRMVYEDGRDKIVRFVFTAPGDRIEHLCNSDIAFVPQDRLRPNTTVGAVTQA